MKLDVGDIDSLRPVIGEAVRATLAAVEANENLLPVSRIGLTEPEAAAALGVAGHVLRDCRLRGEIAARKVGSRYVYSRSSLIAWLAEGSR